MKKKNWLKKWCSLVLAFAMVMSLAACGNSGTKSGDGDALSEQADSGKTQLYVFNFSGGFGAEWLAAAKKRYEELHKDDVYEEGKKGIQIIINSSKTSAELMQNQILHNKEEVYFTELAYYYTLLDAGVLGDITEAVTTDLSVYGDEAGSTILGKMTDEQKDFYGVEKEGQTHYYGIPHYAGYVGLIYNVDLFDEEKYYFADGVTDAAQLEDYFIVRSTDKKSAGPDGEYNTSDDGLPVTFDEFYLLCDYIADHGQTPLNWKGNSYDDYLNRFMLSVETNIEGKEQMLLNYSMNGTATTLGTADANGFTLNSGSKTITAENGYEMYGQAGKYYALDFLHTLATTEKYHGELVYNSGYSHMNAQEDFLYAGHDGGQTDPIAMLVEGVWWENEAETTFESMKASMGEDYAKENRKFAMMPLPKVSKDDARTNTLYDSLYSMCFMKSNIEDWKKPIAQDFIAFVNSDESLVEFTQMTNTPKALNYKMSDEQLSKMTYFGRTLIELKNNSDIVYPFSKEAIYVNQPGSFHSNKAWESTVNGTAYTGPAQAFHEAGVSVFEYFAGMLKSQKDKWNQKIY